MNINISKFEELKNSYKINDEIILIDVREQYEFEQENIEDSINLPISSIMADDNIFDNEILDKFPSLKSIVFICRSGYRSKNICSYFNLFMKNKLENIDKNNNPNDWKIISNLKIYNLEGGMLAYAIT